MRRRHRTVLAISMLPVSILAACGDKERVDSGPTVPTSSATVSHSSVSTTIDAITTSDEEPSKHRAVVLTLVPNDPASAGALEEAADALRATSAWRGADVGVEIVGGAVLVTLTDVTPEEAAAAEDLVTGLAAPPLVFRQVLARIGGYTGLTLPPTRSGEPATTTPNGTAPFDPQSVITPADEDLPGSQVVLPSHDGTTVYQLSPVFATGADAVESADAELDPLTGRWMVALVLQAGDAGLDAWNRAALDCFNAADTCTDGGMAIVFDHLVISAPVPQIPEFDSTEISITGDFSEGEARLLATVLEYATAPIAFRVERTEVID